MLGFLASRGEGKAFNLGPMTWLDHSGLLCNKVLLKCNKDNKVLLSFLFIKEIEKTSDIDIRKGQRECPHSAIL